MARGTRYSQEFKEDAVRYRLEHPEVALRKLSLIHIQMCIRDRYIKESEAYLDQQEIKKLAVDLDNFSYEYDTYGYKDTVENREEQVEKITEDILNKDTAGLKNWLIEVSEESDIDSDVVTARSLLSRLENAETLSVFTRQPEQEQPEATITFYVAECMEFPVMGEYHENLTLEAVSYTHLDVYKRQVFC